MTHRVVITGLGPVTSCGVGVEALRQNLWSGNCPALRLPENLNAVVRTQWFLPLPQVSLKEFGMSPAEETLLQPEDRLAVTACRLALEDARFQLQGGRGRLHAEGVGDIDLLLGTGLSGMQTALESYLTHMLGPEAVKARWPERRILFSRMVVPKSMPDSPVAWSSILLGFTGNCFTLNASCASGTYAVGEVFRRVQSGSARVALAGGVEALRDDDGFTLRGFDILGVLTQSPDGRPEPFGAHRTGFLFAEGGACVLVLEQLEHALARGARIYAELADYQSNSDAWNLMQIDPQARQITRLVRGICANREIDYVNAHGTGTIPNDETEARVYREAFSGQDHQPWVNSTKGVLGHTLGASGAIEAAVTALTVSGDVVHPNLTRDPLPGLNLPDTQVSAPIRQALSVSFGFGGHNGALLFRKYAP